MRANNSWKVYLAVEDATKTVETAEANGAHVVVPTMAVADMGTQAVLVDPTGATVGIWQPGTFPGFTVVNELGTANWFELLTRDFSGAVDFYRRVFGWDTRTVGDSDEFRYTTMKAPARRRPGRDHGRQGRFFQRALPAEWAIYWEAEVDDTVAKAKALGGSVVMEAQDTPVRPLGGLVRPGGRPVQAAPGEQVSRSSGTGSLGRAGAGRRPSSGTLHRPGTIAGLAGVVRICRSETASEAIPSREGPWRLM